MVARDYESAPATQTLGLDGIIGGLADDLKALRRGEITVNDALARAALAKQIFNGARLYLQATKLLSDNAKPVPALSQGEVDQ